MAALRDSFKRGGLLAGAAALTLAFAAPAAHGSAGDAANWLTGQLAGGDHIVTYYDNGGSPASFDDGGGTLDTALAFDAVDPTTYATEIDATLDWASDDGQMDAYAGDGTVTNAMTCATSQELYVGPLAKLSFALLADGRDPTNVGSGRDLLEQLKCRQQVSGRFTDDSAFGDFSNMFGLAFATLALNYADPSYVNPNGSDLADAVAYLKAQQCNGGSATPGAFRVALGGSASACTAATGTGVNAADMDATAMAAQGLYAVGETTAADNAVNWLKSVQVSGGANDGAWQSPACTGTAAPSANSTGLAIGALVGQSPFPTAAVADAQNWLLSVQHTTLGTPDWLPGCASTIAPPAGVPLQNSNNVRATTQGSAGMAGVSFEAQLP